jgi:large subunit ribosomal protein L13
MNYTVDATGKTLGRLASEVAVLLMGKNSTTFVRNSVSGNVVIVENASKIKVDPRKLEEKTYARYSGYPGGLKTPTMAQVIGKKGYREVVTIAVKGMLPDNKLKSIMMKNLTVNE